MGLRVPRQQVSAPAERSSVSNAVVPPRSFTRAAGEQPSERGATHKSESVAPASAKAGSAAFTPLSASRAVTSSGSAAAPSPMPSADSMPAPLANPAGNASAQIAGRQKASTDQVPTGQAPTQQPTWTDLLLAPPADRPSRFAAPATAEPVAGPIPLPRKRPHHIAFAEATIPLPQPRPDAAGPERAPAGPSDWLGGIFQSSPSSNQEPEPVHRGDY
jgi:hypothetical protein